MITRRSWGDRQILLGLTLAALVLFCLNLGGVPLRDWDEGTRGLIAREIYRTGNWLHPTEFGEPYLLKPPLMDWLMAFAYDLGGVNEWTSRLPGAIATALGIPLLYCLGQELFQARQPALYSALIYLTLLPVVRHGRLAMLDGLVMSGMILSLWCLLRARRQPIWGLGCGVGLGVIAFTKGLLMLPIAAIACLFILWDRHWQTLKNPYLWCGIGIGLLPTLLWYHGQIQYYGDRFIQTHFLNQGLKRVADTVESHQQPPWFYLLEIIKYTAPWLFFLPQSYWHSWQNRPASAHKLILAGSLFYLGLISTMGTKLPWYVMPIYPFIALALGFYFFSGWQPRSNSFFPLHWLFYGLAIAILSSIIYFYLYDPQLSLMVMAVVVSLTFALAGWHWHWQHPNFITVLIIGSYFSLSLLFLSQSWLWELNEAFPVQPIGDIIRATTPRDSKILTTFSYRRPSLDFYGDRPVRPTPLNTIADHQYWLIDQEIFSERNNQLPTYQILGETPEFKLIYTAASQQ